MSITILVFEFYRYMFCGLLFHSGLLSTGSKIRIKLNKLGLNESDPMTAAADQKDFFFQNENEF